MNNEDYFCSITDEINAVQNRVRNFIQHHWLSDGEWKESVLRSILRRHLPKTIGVGNGFMVSAQETSTQIDILLFDNNKPVLFQDGDFVIVTPDCVRGIIEVKTTARKGELATVFEKIADNIEKIPTGHANKRFFGVFFYEADDTLPEFSEDAPPLDIEGLKPAAAEVLGFIKQASKTLSRRIINCVSIGDSFFTRYWIQDPNGNQLVERWHAYDLKRIAPAYFIHNVIEHLCPESVLNNNAVWYPEHGKEIRKIVELTRQ